MQLQTLGRYRILQELGRGAMGQVYSAHDPQIERQVAVKTAQVIEELPDSERAEARARFLREARSIGRLAHPNIVTLYDADESEGVPFLVMEYVEGEALDAFCTPDTLLPPAVVVELLAQAAEGLHYAHAASVIHRDIKPANLLRVGEMTVKITDFGVALNAGEITGSGDLHGSPSYMSPEQVRGGKIDGRSDLFSLGVVLYEMLTGSKPFAGTSVSSVLYRIVNEEPRDAADLNPAPHPALCDVLRKALNKQPDQRYQTGEEMADALRQAAVAVRVDTAVDLGGPAMAEAAHAPAPRRDPFEDPPADENDPFLAAHLGGKASADAPSGFEPAPPKPTPVKSSARPFVLAAVLVVALGASGWYAFRHGFGNVAGEGAVASPPPAAPELWLETSVRTEPPGLSVRLDGIPLEGAQVGQVRFRSAGPFGALTAEQGCRKVEHTLSPSDAGGEVVLVLDPTELRWSVPADVPGAAVRVNGEAAGVVPAEIRLDLCRENRVELLANGHRPSRVQLAAGALPIDARKQLFELSLEPIPRGTLTLRRGAIQLVYYVDGRRLKSSETRLELDEGEHELRYKNEYHWIDERVKLDVVAGQELEPELPGLALGTLVVQAFPSNCKVFLRRPGGSWRYLDETPASRRVATGRYEVKVELKPTGQIETREIELTRGANPPVRVSFGAGT